MIFTNEGYPDDLRIDEFGQGWSPLCARLSGT